MVSTSNPHGGTPMKTHLGHYEIVEELGRGGMGVVYKGFEPALNRFVAIKELSPSLAHDADLVERFLREARSMAQLSDPHIIQIYFIGTDASTQQPFFAMEYVEGDSLSALLKRQGRFAIDDTLKIIHQTALGLATAHDQGVIHRDIKPGNLMLTKRGQVKIADFGIALATRDISRKLTSTGEFVGTPGYLSPEVCLAKNIDQRSDIFSLGIVMFEMLTGRSPFTDESPLGLMLEVVKAEIPDIRQLNGEADPQTAAILAKMVAKEPSDRFASCHDLAAALQAHPLVAKGGAVKLATATPVPNDGATLIGAPTPASIQARKVTPPPLVGGRRAEPASDAQGDSAPTLRNMAVPPRPSVLERDTQRKSSKLPLAIAAVLLLAVAGGAFALKNPILDFVKGFGDGFAGQSDKAYEKGLVAGNASNPVGTSNASPLDANSYASQESSSPQAWPGAAQTSSEPSSPEPASQSSAYSGMQPSEQYSETQTTSTPVETPAQTDNPGYASSSTYPSAPTSASSPSGDLSNTVAQTAVVEAAAIPQAPPSPSVATPAQEPIQAPGSVQVAIAQPPKPKPQPVPAAPRRVAVIAIGDSALVGPAKQRIEDELVSAGFELAEGPESSGSVDAALRSVSRAAQIAIVVKAEPIGSTQLNYYGRSSELYSANLSVRAYRTSDKSPLGSGFRQKVQFTDLNADTQAVDAVNGNVGGLISTLSPYKRG